MTTATCSKPVLSLPVLAEPHANPLATAITGPHSIAAVKMLRISVTDVCNLRCLYCMPEEGVAWLPKSEILTFEEIVQIVRAAVALGLTHFKLTGGEPTARKDLPLLAAMIKKIPGVQDLSLTTNGILLAPLLDPLKSAGLDRLTVSLDSLIPEKFSHITRGGDFHKVWAALEKALTLNFARIKINVVAMRGLNEDELPAFAALTKKYPLTVRFIEFMPLASSTLADANPDRTLLTESEMRQKIESHLGPLTPIPRHSETGVGPANIFILPHAPGRIGFISAMSHPFCDTCNRLRLTPDGLLRSCLFDGGEVDLKPLLRTPPPPTGNLQSPADLLTTAFTTCVQLKPTTHSAHGNKAMNRIGG